MSNLTPIEHQNQRILSTQQLAEKYGTNIQILTNNYNRNKNHYTEGKHYYRLEGEEKRQFLNLNQIDLSLNAKYLYLWTEKGALLHAKSLNTDQAWQAYEWLVDEYYRIRGQALTQQPAPKPNLDIALDLFIKSYTHLYPETLNSCFQYLWKEYTGTELKHVSLVPVSYPPYPSTTHESGVVENSSPVVPMKPSPSKKPPVATNVVADKAIELIKNFVKKHSRALDPRYGIKTKDYILIRNSVFNSILTKDCPRQAVLRNLARRGLVKSEPCGRNDEYRRYAFRRYDRYLGKNSHYIMIKAEVFKNR